MMTDGMYRLNAGIVVFNQEGKVLVCKRADFDNQWQFPQGGIENNENPRDAAQRELKEETNISSVKYVADYPRPLIYNFPEHILRKFQKMGRKNIGQKQYWYLFFFEGNEAEIDFMTNKDEIEFNSYKWIEIMQAVDLIVDFKKDVYQKVCSYFSPIINEYIKS